MEQAGVKQLFHVAGAEQHLGKNSLVMVHDPGQGHAQTGHALRMAGGKGITGVNGRGQGLHEGIDQGLNAFEVQGIAHGDTGHGCNGADVLQMAGFETPCSHTGQGQHTHALAAGREGR
jgi:hypothetical protein